VGGDGNGDVIYGGAGNDSLNGGDGNDQILFGGSGDDIFVFTEAHPFGSGTLVGDFSNDGENDSIQLEIDGFSALTTAVGSTLSSTEFKANDTGTADEADDRIIYNTRTGDLYYDADGNGGGGAVFIAHLASAPGEDPPTLTAADFTVIDL
jgi:Ca2+-binding RTX toxin-like protein